MKKTFRKKTKIKTSATGSVVIASVISGTLITAAFGPIGILAGGAALILGIAGSKANAKEKINRVFTKEDEKRLLEENKDKHCFTTKVKYNKCGVNDAILGKLLFGDNITVENTYYRK